MFCYCCDYRLCMEFTKNLFRKRIHVHLSNSNIINQLLNPNAMFEIGTSADSNLNETFLQLRTLSKFLFSDLENISFFAIKFDMLDMIVEMFVSFQKYRRVNLSPFELFSESLKRLRRLQERFLGESVARWMRMWDKPALQSQTASIVLQ